MKDRYGLEDTGLLIRGAVLSDTGLALMAGLDSFQETLR